jgi:hypothetical protein
MIQSTICLQGKRRRERFLRFPHANEWGGGEGGKGEFCGKVRDSKQGFRGARHAVVERIKAMLAKYWQRAKGAGRARDGGQVWGHSGRRCITSQRFCCATLSDNEGSLRFLQVEAYVVAGGKLREVVG